MKPLDPYIEIIEIKFPKYIPVEETSCQAFKLDAILFREQFQNNYCYLELKSNGKIKLSFFHSDYSKFNDIEFDYLQNAVSFEVENLTCAAIIVGSLI